MYCVCMANNHWSAREISSTHQRRQRGRALIQWRQSISSAPLYGLSSGLLDRDWDHPMDTGYAPACLASNKGKIPDIHPGKGLFFSGIFYVHATLPSLSTNIVPDYSTSEESSFSIVHKRSRWITCEPVSGSSLPDFLSSHFFLNLFHPHRHTFIEEGRWAFHRMTMSVISDSEPSFASWYPHKDIQMHCTH